MKLYVFLVNTGITLTFDTELAVQTVTDLKHAIQTKYKIAVQHQILVVNGGECMAPDRRVCSYSAGTDTNPIFLFNKEMILCERPPAIPRTTFSAENEMELKVEESLMMPAVFHTVASRTQLAVEMYEVAKKLCSFCEGLVHDEHLQHQGWAAIMANLEDCTHSYQKLLFKFDNAYSKYLQSTEEIKMKLTNLGTAVSVMAKIPLLECLTRHSYRMCLDRLLSSTEGDVGELENEKTSNMVQYEDNTKRKNVALLASLSTSGEPTTQELQDNRTELENTDSPEQDTEALESRTECPQFNVSLLDWINVQDRPNDVETLVRKCFDSMSRGNCATKELIEGLLPPYYTHINKPGTPRKLEGNPVQPKNTLRDYFQKTAPMSTSLLDPQIIQPFLAECRQTVAKLDNQNMKAIKGLEDRLYALDQMIASCSRLVNEQKELAQGFLANQKRAENLKDPSVLPDLCLSHANQLMIMLTNHRKLLDIKQKCTTAKQELANNLQVRLKWCCFVMLHADQDGEKLQALFRLLTELLERVKIVEALSNVPQMYCLAVVEVVRRKMFTKHYREWASALVKDGKSLYENEKTKRETFGKLFRKSYLRNRLFRGLESWPSSFCTRKPRKFDSELPDISVNDLQFLQSLCPPEVQLFLRVPLLCDFEPLNQHVRTLHNLVKAAQSLDEMSQTITDLLNEQKVSNGQGSPHSATTPRIQSATEATTTTSSKTPPSLSLQGPICPSVAFPAPLEELSPDSIDAHFDFETITHPHAEQSLKQGSLDLDSLADSPESDFMSAVNEFVIEETPVSPNISDTQSPEMMVESLYSSVINAIDSRRMQDTKGSKEDTAVSLKACVERCRVVVHESQANLRNFREELCQLKILIQREQSEFAGTIIAVSAEILRMIEFTHFSYETALKEKHFEELQRLEKSYERQLQLSKEHISTHEDTINSLKSDITTLKEDLQTKEVEVTAIRNENETFIYLQSEKDQKVVHLENIVREQTCEIQNLKSSRESASKDLQKVYAENKEKLRALKEEFLTLEKTHLNEVENNLQLKHAQELEDLKIEHKCSLEKLLFENKLKIDQLQETSVAVSQEKDSQLKELNLRVTELSDLRCKLEVELALKEGEVEDMKLIMKENKAQQQDSLKYQIDEQTEALKREIIHLNQIIQNQKEQHIQGLEELKIVLTGEKNQCISTLLHSHEAETKLLQKDISDLTSSHQQALETESRLQEEINVLQNKLEDHLKRLEEQSEQHKRVLMEQKDMYEASIKKLEEREQLLYSQKFEKDLLPQMFTCEKEDFCGVKQFELQMQTVEKELSEKVQLLEQHLNESSYKRLPAGEQKPVIAEGHSAPGWMGGKLFATKEYIEGLLPENYGHINKPGTPRKLEGNPVQPKDSSMDYFQKDEPTTTSSVNPVQPKNSTRDYLQKLQQAGLAGVAHSLLSDLQGIFQQGKQLFTEKLEMQERKKAEELQNLRISLIAEQQTNFNTVLTRERVKKENIISELSEKLKTVTLQQDRDKDLIETLSEDRASLLQEKKKLEEEISKLQNIVSSAHEVFPSEPAGACAPDLSSELNRPVYDTTIIEEDRMEPTLETSMTAVHDVMLSEEKQKILFLERTLQLKEEENKRLNQRLMSQSMSSVSSRHSEKIAIRDFQVGDLVLIILDERHDNYVLFTVSPTLYFLHSESLSALDLKPASGSSRRPWVLGKVMEKEYCQAKKAQNRFKVPLGTKFYRVKAVPWNKKV